MIEYAIAAAAAPIAAFVTVYITVPALIRYLIRINSVVPDYFKKEKTMVARPGGPAIIAGILASEAVLYALVPSTAVLTIMIASSLAFVVGFIDDKRVMGGWYKPLALAVIAVPVIMLGAYDTDLAFPLFGSVKIPLLYFAVIAIIITITGNTINSIDILNGVASGFMIIAGSTITLCLVIVQNYEGRHSQPAADLCCFSFLQVSQNPLQDLPRRLWRSRLWSHVRNDCNRRRY